MARELTELELRRRLAVGARWMVTMRLVAQMISWLVTLAVVRFLAPADYGVNAMIEAPIELLMLFGMAGFDRALVQRRRADDAELSAAFGVLLAVNLVLCATLVLGADQIAQYFREERLKSLIPISALVFLILPFRVIPSAMLDRDLAFKEKSIAELLAVVISSLLSLGLAVAGAGVWALLAAVVANWAFGAILLAYMRPWMVAPSFRFWMAKDLIRRGGVMTASAALLVVSGKLVNVMAGPQLGPEVLGYFSIAFGFALMAMSKVMPIVIQTMYPAFAHLDGMPGMVERYVCKTLEMASIAIFPISIGLACVSGNFVNTVFGEKWSPVVIPLAALSLVTPIRMVSNVMTPALNALGHVKSVFFVYLTMCVSLAGGLCVATGYGLVGLVAVWLLVTPMITLVTLVVAQSRLGISLVSVAKALAPATAGCCAMAGVLGVWRLLQPDGYGAARLATEVAVGAAVYIATIAVFFRQQFDGICTHMRGRA